MRREQFLSRNGAHGWQWAREISLKNSSVWAFDPASNTWRDRRPVPEPRVSPLRCASYDSDHGVIVVFGGEGNSEGTLAYDPFTNTWTRVKPPEQPPFRSGGNMAYDAARKVHVLFGAQFTNDPKTWLYDLRANRWTGLTPRPSPPTDKNDAVLTYDPINKVVLAIVRVQEGKGDKAPVHLETWAFDTGKRAWKKMSPEREPDPTGNRARLFTFLPDHGVALLENRPSRPAEQQIWTYRYAAPRREPAAPEGLAIRTAKGKATLTWKSAGSRLAVLRGEGEVPWKAVYRRVATLPGKSSRYEDADVKPGTVYYYRLQVLGEGDNLGAITTPVRTQPALVEDVAVSVKAAKEVEVKWSAPPGDDIVGYHVERAVVEVYTDDQLKRMKSRTAPLKQPSVAAIRRIGPFERLTEKLLTIRKLDDKVDLKAPATVKGKTLWERAARKEELDAGGKAYPFAVYAYRVRAVNALGVEGGPSAYALTIPSAPQYVFSREKGTSCELKWAANPEKGLAGYRVYRLDGRWNKDAVSRLTEEPIDQTTFTDTKAGKASRRYHIVAVDGLGQEGLPSAPVWFEREWKSFYKPFIGEWHQ